jgi:hypothetical protein
MRRKRCECCHELYEPLAHTYREQKTCDKPSCRVWRKRQSVKRWKVMNPLSSGNNPIKQKRWRQSHRRYWIRWRNKHPGYVIRNRRAQMKRDARKRKLLAKGNALNTVYIDKLRRIRFLRLLAKRNAWEEIVAYQIDGICAYLQSQLVLAKGNTIDIPPIGMRK